MKIKKDSNLLYKSEEAREIIGQIPNWLIRWGISVIFCVFLILFFISWSIKYPETIYIPLIINRVSENIDNNPEESNFSSDKEFKYFGEGFVREKYYMDVNVGQQVNIKLAAYNFHEYGILRGIIIEKNLDPESNRVKVLIDLEGVLITSYKKKIEYYSGMSGIAEIVIRDQRLLERFFSKSRILLRK